MRVNLPVTRAQRAIIECDARQVCLVCGRRWGKTYTLNYMCLRKCLTQPNQVVWMCQPTYQQALRQMRRIAKIAALKPFIQHVYKQFPPRFEFKNGSEWCFQSLDRPDNLLGEGLDLCVVDEAARVKRDVVMQILMPMTLDRRGQMVYASTYRGRNWFYDESLKGKDAANWRRIRTFIHKTESGAAFSGKRGKEALELYKASIPPALWAQECDCEPLAATDCVFRYVDRAVGGHLLMGPEFGHRYIMGLDLGRVVDPTSWVILDERTGQVVATRVLALGTPHEESAKAAAAEAARWRAYVVVDATGGASGGRHESYVQLYTDAMRAVQVTRVRVFHFTPAQMESYVGALSLGIERGAVKIPDAAKELLAQVRLYRYAQSEMSKWIRFGAPSGEHDDLVAALIMAWWCKVQQWPGDPNSAIGPAALVA